jgi:hypothetical protein
MVKGSSKANARKGRATRVRAKSGKSKRGQGKGPSTTPGFGHKGKIKKTLGKRSGDPFKRTTGYSKRVAEAHAGRSATAKTSGTSPVYIETQTRETQGGRGRLRDHG